ncbi:MAG TPA: ABC transporter permease [Candidatus Sulfotelmatobacter sp.]|nr:ABC transporter permease [Candidatus Sulfotelmatobacter sp.]
MGFFPGQLRQVFRRLGRSPLFTAIILITVAVGVGANTVVFSVVEGVLLKPLSYSHPERLIGVWYKAPAINIPRLHIGAFVYFMDREQNKTLEDIGMYDGSSFSLTGSGQPEQLDGVEVTDGTLPILGVHAAYGRLFTNRDDSPNAPKTVLLSYGYWQRHFGGDRSAVGRTLSLDGEPHEIIGILPQGFDFLGYRADLFVPMQIDRSKTTLGQFNYEGIARLKPGVTLQEASADLQRLIPVALRSFPPPEGFSLELFQKANFGTDLHPLKDDVVGDIGSVVWVLMGSIMLVLLAACANVANLLLVRVEGRRQELAIRSALGADRRNITANLLLESLVLGCSGSVIGLGLAYGGLRALIAAAPTGLPRLRDIGIDVPVLLFTLGLALFVSLVIGMIPVLRYSGVRAGTGLREGGRSLSQSRERHRARKALVVVQVALALVLLICSGLMIRTFRALAHVWPGFQDPNTLQAFDIDIPETQIPDTQGERVVRIDQAILNQVAAIPGVTSAGITSSVPMSGGGGFDPVFANDHAYKDGEMAPMRHQRFISPGYFSTMGIPLVAGRDLTWPEEFEQRPVAIISENFAREYWGTPNGAIGKFIRIGSSDPWHQIVGAVGNVYEEGVSHDPTSDVYWPIYQANFETQKVMLRRYVSFVVRTPRAGSAALMNEIQRAVWSVDPELPLASPTTVGALYTKSMARTSFTLVMLSIAGAMTLLLGIVGLYGVVAYAVSQRTREIGIRVALGAQRDSLTRMFVRQGLMLTGIGVICGVLVAFGTMRLMRSLLYHVSPADPWTYAGATAAILAIAWMATYVPSRRAAVVDPVQALRAE